MTEPQELETVRLADICRAGELLTLTHHTPAALDWEISRHPRAVCRPEYCGRIAP